MATVELNPQLPYYPDVEPALRKLDERALRERVLPDFFRALGFFDVRHRHGPHEEGKDLLAWRTSVLETHDWVGFVVKRGDLNAQVTSSAGIRTVLHQVEQVLDHEVTDPVTSAQSVVRECWVITNGDIPGHAIDEISHTLRRHHLEQAVRWIDVTTLARLLCRRLPREKLVTMLDLGSSPGQDGGVHG